MDQYSSLQPPQQPPQFPSTTDAPPSFIGFTPPQPAPPPSHPSYAEMITAAIVWESKQGKGGGSSKRAIANYIDRVYTNLPPNHSSLLTYYLKELKQNGYLVMVKNSYQLGSVLGGGAGGGAGAGAGAGAGLAHTGSAPPPDLNTANQVQVQQQQSDGVVDPAPKRRPGRPPRSRTEPVQAQGQENGTGSGLGESGRGGGDGVQSGSGKKRGRPPKQQVIHSDQAEHQIMMETSEVPFMVQPEAIITDGFEEEEPKQTLGRPQKLTPVVPTRKQAHSQVNGPGQVMEEPMPVMSKRKPGRPPGIKSDVGGEVEGVVVGKTRGRLKRGGLRPVLRPEWKRPCGRPPRGGGGAVVAGKRRGRPPKVSGGAPKVRRLSASGKPMGRPRKNAVSPKLVSEQMTKEELTKKLDLIQSKVRDAVDVLRPYIPQENAPLMALQQLQELVAPIVTAPQTAPPVNMNAPPPTGTVSEAPSEPVTAPYMNVPGPFSTNFPQMTANAPFQVPSSFDNQQRMSWMASNEAQS